MLSARSGAVARSPSRLASEVHAYKGRFASREVRVPQRSALPFDGEQKHAEHDKDGSDDKAPRQLLDPLQ